MSRVLARSAQSFRQLSQFVAVPAVLMALTHARTVFAGAASAALFQAPVSYASGGSFAASVAVADFDEDGALDVVVANCAATENGCLLALEHGTVAVLLGNADGTLQAATNYDAGGIGTRSVTVSDVNADGHADLLWANSFSNTVGVMLGNGAGSFQQATLSPSGGVHPSSIQVADLNGDSKSDLVVANTCNAELCSGGAVSVLLGGGDGTFQAATPYLGANADGVTIADLNGDGQLDLVVPSGFFTVAALFGKGDGTFSAPVSFDTRGFGSRAAAVADMNQDGRLDIVVSNCASDAAAGCGGTSGNGIISILLGDAKGRFGQVLTFDSDGKADSALIVTDLDGDRRPDVLVAHSCNASGDCSAGTVSFLQGRGNGTLAPALTFSAGAPGPAGASSLALGDLNDDGNVDLLVADGNSVGVLLRSARPTHACHPFPRHRHGHRPGQPL